MAGGFRSPAVVIGYSGPQTGAGYITLPWWQAGGGTVPTTQGGYYTLPWWQAGGGVGEDPVVDTQVRGGKKRRRLVLPNRLEELEFSYPELFPEALSDLSKEAITKGKVEVEGTTVLVPSAPEMPKLALAKELQPLSTISDSIEREIADLMRIQARVAYTQQVEQFRQEALRFDEEFLVLLVLLLDG